MHLKKKKKKVIIVLGKTLMVHLVALELEPYLWMILKALIPTVQCVLNLNLDVIGMQST